VPEVAESREYIMHGNVIESSPEKYGFWSKGKILT